MRNCVSRALVSGILALVTRSLGRTTIPIVLLLSTVYPSAVTAEDHTTIDANSFTLPADYAGGLVNDFHLIIDGNFDGDPTCDKFPNVTVHNTPAGQGGVPPASATADFSGASIGPGNSINVKFKAKGDKPNPRGYFTKDGTKVYPADDNLPRSKALDGSNVAFVPNGQGGFDAGMLLANNVGTPLRGVVQVYVNTGFLAYGNLNEYDTLRNPRLLFASDYFLQNGQVLAPITTTLLSADEYLLIVGLADALDGAGPLPFAIAKSPFEGAQPIPLMGFNADVIVDQDPTVRFAQPFDANTFAWFESGAVDDHGVAHADGLPAGLTMGSQTGSGAIYQIQPAFGANVLQLSPGLTGTLSLMVPQPYSILNIIASSGNGTPTSTGIGNINFADGSTQVFNLNLFDWCNGVGGLHPEAVLPSPNGRADVGTSGTAFSYQNDCDFQLYETVIPIDPVHAGIPILSIDFTGAPDAFYSNIFGVSGQ